MTIDELLSIFWLPPRGRGRAREIERVMADLEARLQRVWTSEDLVGEIDAGEFYRWIALERLRAFRAVP